MLQHYPPSDPHLSASMSVDPPFYTVQLAADELSDAARALQHLHWCSAPYVSPKLYQRTMNHNSTQPIQLRHQKVQRKPERLGGDTLPRPDEKAEVRADEAAERRRRATKLVGRAAVQAQPTQSKKRKLRKLDETARGLEEAKQSSNGKRQKLRVEELEQQVIMAQKQHEEDKQSRLVEATTAQALLQRLVDTQSAEAASANDKCLAAQMTAQIAESERAELQEALDESGSDLEEARQALRECRSALRGHQTKRVRAEQQVVRLQTQAQATEDEVAREKKQTARQARYRQRVTGQQATKQRQQIEKQLSEERPNVEVQRDKWKCKVCLDRQVSVMLIPCGHLSLCSTCATQLQLERQAGDSWAPRFQAAFRCPIC